MTLWTTMALIALVSFSAVAIGIHAALVAVAGVLAAYAIIVASIGLGHSDETRAMAFGFGLMALIPVAGAAILAVALGSIARQRLLRHGIQPLAALRPSPVASSREEAVAIALRQFRDGSAIGIKCPSCRRRLAARRVLSSTPVPDIALACRCGTCSGVHPFRPAGT